MADYQELNLGPVKGADGADGTPAGFGTPTATVDGGTGTPSVDISATGPDTAKVFSFAFHNLKGEKGDTGAQGPAGADGVQGPAGADGAQGPAGDQGPAGQDGGYYSPTVDASGNLSWTASKEGMPAVSGTNIRGPQGEQGPQGPAGADGAQGPAGQDGAQGPAGEDGGYYTPSVSASGDLTWTGSKAGMAPVSGVNIRGPQGIQGPAGQDGAQGPAGADGAQGPAGANATINGVNALTLEAANGLSGQQSGSTYTIKLPDGGSVGDVLKKTASGAEWGSGKPPYRVVTLPAASWSDNSQTVTVNGVKASETAQLIQPMPAVASQDAYMAAGIICSGQAANQLTFKCSTVPTEDLTLYVVLTEVSE